MILKLFSPFIPCICEEIYSCLYEEEFNKKKSISSRNNFPKISNDLILKSYLKFEEMKKIIFDVRKYKSEKNISIKEKIETITVSTEFDEKIKNDLDLLKDIKNVCNVDKINFIKNKLFSINFHE